MATPNRVARCEACGFEASGELIQKGRCPGCRLVEDKERRNAEPKWYRDSTLDQEKTLVRFRGEVMSLLDYYRNRRKRYKAGRGYRPINDEIALVSESRLSMHQRPSRRKNGAPERRQ